MMPSVPTVRQGSIGHKSGGIRLFGFEITRVSKSVPEGLQQPASRGREWWPIISEPFTGAWQRNIEQRNETVVANNAVYSSVTLIGSDVSKMCIRLVEEDSNGIWNEVDVPAFSPVLRKPNRYQNRIKFIEQWVVSKLLHGNTYVLKQRDNRGVVVAMYILDPLRTKPLVAPDGSVYYQINKDNLAGIEASTITVPASEIIHDLMVPLFHPLCGVSPLFACGLAAMQGMSIQQNSTKFFQNGAMPGGVLTAPGTIDDVTATRLKDHWEKNYSGINAGRVAVLGDGLKYEKMMMTSVESQMIEQLKWTAETVCSCFHVPPYMIGVAAAPAYNNIEALNQQYYSQCLQAIIESIELCLDEGLGLTTVQGHKYGTEFDLDDLLRMDTATQIEALAKAVGGSIMTPNAALKKMNQPPVKGGDTIYMQQQNFSLEALSKRDAQQNPFALAPKADQRTPTPADEAAAAAAAETPAAAPSKSRKMKDVDLAVQNQMFRWMMTDALEAERQKIAA